jgi:fatty-acyl-CoA synthase
LHAHPLVVEAHVIGEPDDEFGEQVMAWVSLRDGDGDAASVESILKEHCRGTPRFLFLRSACPIIEVVKYAACCIRFHSVFTEHLAHYKVPKFFHFTKTFPVTVTGKVRKVEMREMAKKMLGL